MPSPRAPAARPFNPLSVEKINLVQSSFETVRARPAEAVELFYGRLFEIAPQVKPLFRTSTEAQGQKLIDTLSTLISGLRDFEALQPDLKALAEKHMGYGVTAGHYEPMGEALLWTLDDLLGEDFTPAVRHAWASIYHIISRAMIAATEEPAPTA